MTLDKSMALVRDFPKLYANYGGDPAKTNMAFGFDCGDGWEPIIRRLSEQLEPMGVAAAQVKEKFGVLRFYINGGPDEAYAAIQEAEERSAKTCEWCGKPGELRLGGWIRTLCDPCEGERG